MGGRSHVITFDKWKIYPKKIEIRGPIGTQKMGGRSHVITFFSLFKMGHSTVHCAR